MLELQDLCVTRRNRPVLTGVSLGIGPGEFIGLIGPNGAGKSTLMEAALGLIPATGRSSLAMMAAPARARHAAYLPQAKEIAWPVSVRDLVSLGRLPWPGGGGTVADRDAIDHAIARMGLGEFAHRTAQRLSGGEQARVLIARALAQDTPLLLADEPIAGLDPAQQLATMRLFAALAQEGRGVIASIHDLGLAARFCTRLVLLAQGRVIADGTPDQVLRDDLMSRAFGITLRRVQTPDGLAILPV